MNLKKLKFFLIIGTLNSICLASSITDVKDSNDLLGLGDYLRYAALNNAGLKASFQQWKAAVEQIPQAKSLADPTFTYGYFIEEVETRVGPQEQKFEIMQMFPWFGVIEARTDEAAARAKAAQKRYDAKKLELFEQVKHDFYEFSYLARAIEITEQNLELIKHFEEVVRIRYVTATSSHPDTILAQIELAILEDRLKSLNQLRPAITAKLNSILNRPADSYLAWPIRPAYQAIAIETGQLFEIIEKNNPNLKAADNDIEAARNKDKLAQKKSYPNFGFGVSYIDTAHATASGVRDSGKDPVMAMISLTLPIWSDNYKAAQRQAKAVVRKKTSEKIQLQNNLESTAQQLLYDYQDSQRKINLYKDFIIPKTKEMLSAYESAYKSGAIDFLSLIDAQRMLLKYELFYERSVAVNAQHLAKIEELSGIELSEVSGTGE